MTADIETADIERRPPGRVIEARHVRLSFGQTPALRGASVGVTADEMLATIGPSGSGKSTLLHCMAGILVPTMARFASQVAVSTPCPKATAVRCGGIGSDSCSSSASLCLN